MHIVEVRRASDNLSGPMATMRTWLDVHQIAPKLFQYSIISWDVVFRLEFESGADAAAFGQAFDGRVVGTPGSIAA